jgi:hypothetical protein
LPPTLGWSKVLVDVVGHHGSVFGLGNVGLVWACVDGCTPRLYVDDVGVSVDDVFRVALHRECLARARGPVNEDCTVLAVQEGVA